MKKTLYISDLDGTLLNYAGELSRATRSGVDHLIREGGLFAVATARSPQSACSVLSQLDLNIPSVFINGVMLYNTRTRGPVETVPVDVGVLPRLIEIFEKHGSYGYMYAWGDGFIKIFYNSINTPSEEMYYRQRMEVYNRELHQSSDFIQTAKENDVLYFVMYGEYDTMSAAYADLRNIPELNCSLYRDVYHEYYFIDIIASSVSKATGMLRLREICGADEVVAFGDNYNDITMLKAADRCYVPANGVEEAKELATGIIGGCDEDGVISFLMEDFRKNSCE